MHTPRVPASSPFFLSLRVRLGMGAASFLLCAFITTGPAEAGFQWVSPGQVPVKGAAPAPESSLAPEVAPQNKKSSSLGSLDFETQIIQAPTPAPTSAPEPELLDDSYVAQKTVAPPSASRDVVLGFADKVPLSVALRQVLPSDYGFSVSQDVSMGTLVSWRGGSAWRDVLNAMLQPVGLAAEEHGKMVQVVSALKAEVMPSGIVAPQARVAEPVSRSFEPPVADSIGAPTPLVSSAPAPSYAPSSVEPHRVMGYLTPPPGASLGVAQEPSMVQSAVPSDPDQANPYDVWTGARGDTLRNVLEKWCGRSGVDLSWQSEYDYPLQANVSLPGSFEDAVRSLLVGFENVKPQPVGRLHRNQIAGQYVLVVSMRGNDYNK